MNATELFATLKKGDTVEVHFGGGIDCEAVGTVITPQLSLSNHFRMTFNADVWDRLARQWHRKGSEVIVHANELVAILK